MHIRFSILNVIAIVMLVSCHRAVKGRFDGIAPIDTLCSKEILLAKKDIGSGKMIYCSYFMGLSPRNAHEMDSLLKIEGIEYREEIESDVVLKDQTQGCYCSLMQDRITEKFGGGFIDSLSNIADSIFVLHGINDTFYYADCDLRPNYPGDTNRIPDEFSEIFQHDFEGSLKYPSGYVKRPNYDSSAFVNIALIVDKNGNAKITGYWFLFDMKSNYKFERYFKKRIVLAMKNKNWSPAVIRKRNVTSNMVIRLFFD